MKKIVVAFNIFWWICVAINFGSILWFVLGNTANFQRGVDLVTTVIFMICGVPSLILLMWSLYMLKNGGLKSPFSMLGVTCLLVIMISLSVPLYKNVNTSGWLTENTKIDTMQVTADNQYEYYTELVNTFQRNSSIRLYLKNLHSNEEVRIKLDLPKVSGILWNSKENYFTTLQPTAHEGKYILKTQKLSPFPEAIFEIDIKEGKAIRLE